MTETDKAQDAVFAFLADSTTHGSAKVTRVDTHAASVFLAGEHAYKVKRAVKFPFLDFSTLDKRKAVLDAEIEANKPFAANLYLGLVPITADGGKLTLGGKGPAVEWALKMRRFDETQTLDHLPGERIDRPLAEALAIAIVEAHARAPKVDVYPWIAALRDYIAQNEVDFAAHSTLFPAEQATALIAKSRTALDQIQPLLVSRATSGMVRRGHGDLHLGNIALIDGKPVPFDALEFDPVMASGDMLYDLAFLLMDLVERKRDEAANAVLNTYFAARRYVDIDGLPALLFFMSLRAAIRAKVTAAKLERADAEKRETTAREAQTYFRLACELIQPPSPRLIAVGGLSGTGKSVLARMLAVHLLPPPGALVLRSDVTRKLMFNVAETERLPEAAYKPEVTAKVYAALADQARRIVEAGHSVLIDAVFARPQERATIADAARASRLNVTGLFLTADLATRVARIGKRVNDASDAGGEIAKAQENYDLGELDWAKVDASGTPENTLANARAALRS